MKIKKTINNRAFRALLNGVKRIEIRANKNNKDINSFNLVDCGDEVIFTNLKTHEKLKAVIKRKTLYQTIRELLITEGTRYSLSSTNDLEMGIKSIESIGDYKKLINKNGVFAIEFEEVETI